MPLPPKPWSASPKRTCLLLIVLAVLSCLSGRAAHAQTQTIIDVAVFYTPAAKNDEGGTEQIKTKIDEIIAATNTAYTDSGVNQRLNLVAAEEVRYTERNVDVDYDRLRNPSDGHMDEVHTIRERVWADIVILLSYLPPRGGAGGKAIRVSPISGPSAPDYAFAVVVLNQVFDAFDIVEYSSTMRFAHELGHIMGLKHDRYESCNAEWCPSVDHPYAYGYVNQEAFTDGAATSKRWRTIMSYNNQCDDAGFDCDVILRFSNPNQRYPDSSGDPLGKSGTRNTTAVDGPADAARALNNNRETVANFRPGRGVAVSFDAATYTATEDGTPATVTVQLNVAPGRELVIPLTATSTDGAWPHDYTLPESVTFSAAQTERTLTVTAESDDIDEPDETLTLGFGTLPPGVTAGSQVSATVTLADNDTKAGAPEVESVAITSEPGPSGAYGVNEEIEVTVRFDKHVSVTGTPQIGLTIGTNTRQARYQATRSAGEVLVFTYTVVNGESDADGISIAANSLALNGGTIRDKESTPQNATLTHAAVDADSTHAVEGVKPVLQTATVDGNTVTLTYGETLRGSSTPAPTAFTVTAGGGTVTVRSVRVSGRTVTLGLRSYVAHDQTVTLSYTVPAERPILDASGNAAESLSNQAVTNTTPEPLYDTDDDGLLEIMTLAQLNAIRHDLDGDGRPTSAGADAYRRAFDDMATTDTRLACGLSSGCKGYELDADLDFDTNGDGRIDADDAYWNSGAGWQPIGKFNTTFQGNGHTVSGLFINRSTTDRVGLFGAMDSSAAIRNVGVVDVDVTGRNRVGGLVGNNHRGSITTSYATGRVTGRDFVGGLVGWSLGSITASYATGRVTGNNYVGGLVGEGTGNPAITTSYATGRVTGNNYVGGLVGDGTGTITTNYATGRVSGSSAVGGLVGRGEFLGITASYATGPVTGSSSVGGLVGGGGYLEIEHSYWDTTTSGQTSSLDGGSGKTTAQLQTPTGYSGIYAAWNVDLDGDNTNDDPWDFGTGSQYPALKVNFDGQGAATWQEFGHQLRTGPTSLTATTTTGLVELSWTGVSATAWTPSPDVTYTVYRTTGTTVTAVAEGLTASAYTDRSVTRGTTYTYQIAAVVDGGEATWSAPGARVTAPNQPPAFDDDSTTRTIAENTTGNIGAPVAATDPDDTSLTYSLGGTDADDFSINTSTGQLRTATALDHETRSRYEVTVTVRDSKATDGTADMVDDDTITVTIIVSDVNEPPTFPETTPTMYPVDEGTADKTNIGAPVAATDPEEDTLTYRLSGSDASSFTLVPTTGQLQTKAALDYETKSTYRVSVEVRDDPADTRPDATHAVTITVTNLDEAGMVTLSSATPQEKQAVTATVSDLDGITGSVTWEWERSLNRSTWTAITPGVSSSGTTSRYTPQTADVGQYLRATATYTDGTGTQRTEAATTTNPVLAAPKVSLVLSQDSIAEQGGVSTVTATLDRAVSVATRVTVTASAESPAVAGDFTQSGTTLTIPANRTASEGAVVTVTARDNAVDGPETKAVNVTGTVPAPALVTAPDAVTLMIEDNDERGVTVTPTDLTVNEGAFNTYEVVLTSRPTAAVTVTVTEPTSTVVTVNRTALVFQPGSWDRPQRVTVTAPDETDPTDTTDESATITHTVSGGDYTTTPALRVDDVVVTVEDDEKESTAVRLEVNRATVSEGAGRTIITVTGTLNGAPRTEAEGDTDVSVSVAPDTATQDTDFTADPAGFTLTIPATQKSGTASFALTPQNDTMDEPDETVTVRGSTTAAGLTVTPATGLTVTIADNDDPPPVRLEVADNRIREDGGTTTLTARLLNGKSSAVTEVAVTAPLDAFTLSPSPLTIMPGETMSRTTLTAVNNDLDAQDRRVTITGVVANDQGVGRLDTTTLTLIDDDPPEVSGRDTVRYTEHGTQPVATYTATNPANVRLVWAVVGPDHTHFSIQNGVLRFGAPPDFEASRGNVYQVTVTAADTTSLPGETLTGPGRDVTVIVQDAPGRVRLPSTAPRIGRPFTATLHDPDEVDTSAGIMWCWERSLYCEPSPTEMDECTFPPADMHTSHCDATTTATYTPGNADRDHYLRATATYTDSHGTQNKVAMGVSAGLVSDRPSPRTSGGGGGGGGGGGSACPAADRHGNSAAQATHIGLDTATTGAICPAPDGDYFTLTVPQAGVLVVETTGTTDTVGTVWQAGEELATDDNSGARRNFRLRTRVTAGPVVVAVAGNGRQTGTYTLQVTLLVGFLENPGVASFQSGIGVISGWVCAADAVEMEVGHLGRQPAGYGTERLDTAAVCRDTDNGFGLLVNWNRLGDGEHEVVTFVDGVELGRATVTVTTLGEEFVRDVAGACTVEQFPRPGATTTLVWQQAQQNFVLAAGARPRGVPRAGQAGGGVLENPSPNTFQSGIGVISGWVCEAEAVEIEIGTLGRQAAAYGTERLDTQAVCGDTDNGFGLLVNWNRLGEGEHEVVAYVDDVELGRATVRVTTLGAEFLRGAEGECVVEAFPSPGETVTVEWQQNSQNFVMVAVE